MYVLKKKLKVCNVVIAQNVLGLGSLKIRPQNEQYNFNTYYVKKVAKKREQYVSDIQKMSLK